MEPDRQSGSPGSFHKMQSSTKKSHENSPHGSKVLIQNPIGPFDVVGIQSESNWTVQSMTDPLDQ